MEENQERRVVNHFEAGSNCQVFNGPVSGCVFAMPGSTVTQQTAAVADSAADSTPSAAAATETAATGPKPSAAKEEPNYFQTGRFLKASIGKDWLRLLQSDVRYTTTWIGLLVDELMASEWKDALAAMWESKPKRELLRGYFLGCLKDAGVLAGKYDVMAKVMGYGDNYRTFSRYLGKGKRQPYFDWIADYVRRH